MQHLKGKSILLTRSPSQNIKTAVEVQTFCAKPVLFPCSSVVPLMNSIQTAWIALKKNKQKVDIIFSSRNGVEAVAKHVDNFHQTLATHRVIAVGEKTSDALKEYGVNTAWLPKESSQLGLVQDYPSHGLPNEVVFFRAEAGNDELLKFLQQHHVKATLIPTYQTTLSIEQHPQVIRQLNDGDIDAVLLGSARTVEFYIQKVGSQTLANHPTIAVMSQQVRIAADKLGLNVQVVAKEPNFKSMLEGLDEYFATQEKG